MNPLDAIVDSFELFDDWDDRYAYIIELGEQLAPLPEELRIDDNRVKPCMSQVWIHPQWDPARLGTIRFDGDCDTAIIKGVLAILISLVSGRTPTEVEQLDVDQVFERLRLADHLSPNRHVGIYAIVELMKQQVRELSTGAKTTSYQTYS